MRPVAHDDVPPVILALEPGQEAFIVPSLIRQAYEIHRRENAPERAGWLVWHPAAPEDWLLELCERGEFLHELGHRPGPRRLLEAMAARHRYPEAILTLGRILYTEVAEKVEDLRAFLSEHRDCLWLFESLAREDARPGEKEPIFLEVVVSLPEAAQIRQAVDDRKLEQKARETTDPAEIERLYRLEVPQVWRGLASNPHTPVATLQALCELKGVRFCREIRARAQANLAHRTQP